MMIPSGASRTAQDFIWNLEQVSLLQEETEFTAFPEHDRILLVLEGDAVLVHRGQGIARLKALEQDRFDGGAQTKCFGSIQACQLTVRKEAAGYLDVIRLTEKRQEAEWEDTESYEQMYQVFYCGQGYGVLHFGEETCMIEEGQQIVIHAAAREKMPVTVMGDGLLVRAQIFFNEEIFQEARDAGKKGTADDFLQCMKLSLTNFRGSRFLFPYLKRIWYDESLQAGIRKIERFYLPMLLWIVGIAVLGLCGSTRWQPGTVFGLLGLWTICMLFVVSPFLYFLAVPKPVRVHIRDLESLTPYEKEVRKKEQAANPAADRILKKYKISGRNVYIREDKKQ